MRISRPSLLTPSLALLCAASLISIVNSGCTATLSGGSGVGAGASSQDSAARDGGALDAPSTPNGTDNGSQPTSPPPPTPDQGARDAGVAPPDLATPVDLEPQGPDLCTGLTAEPYENNEGNNAEFTAKFFPTGDRDNEYIDMFFRSSALGTHSYGAGKNADLYTCTQCMLIVRNGKNFYPVKGTITVKAGSKPMKKSLVANLSQLTLIEIKISGSYHSIPVPGGECVTLAPASINVP
jgi:hypothetical protein